MWMCDVLQALQLLLLHVVKVCRCAMCDVWCGVRLLVHVVEVCRCAMCVMCDVLQALQLLLLHVVKVCRCAMCRCAMCDVRFGYWYM